MSTGDPAYLSTAKQAEIVEALPETLHRKASQKLLAEVAAAIAALRADNVAGLAPEAALADVITAFNTLLAALMDSGLMDPQSIQ